jgi:hypothetical protein
VYLCAVFVLGVAIIFYLVGFHWSFVRCGLMLISFGSYDILFFNAFNAFLVHVAFKFYSFFFNFL